MTGNMPENRGFTLVIAEKPSVAKTIANVIGAYRKHDGYLEGSGYAVSWCYGHLVEYALPDAYDAKYRRWDFNDLPIIPAHWQMTVSGDKKKQFHILKQLLSGKLPQDARDGGRV